MGRGRGERESEIKSESDSKRDRKQEEKKDFACERGLVFFFFCFLFCSFVALSVREPLISPPLSYRYSGPFA